VPATLSAALIFRPNRPLKAELMSGARPMGWFGPEEGGGEEGQDPTRRWIVGPLDGTTNFLHGLAAWAVSIAG